MRVDRFLQRVMCDIKTLTTDQKRQKRNYIYKQKGLSELEKNFIWERLNGDR